MSSVALGGTGMCVEALLTASCSVIHGLVRSALVTNRYEATSLSFAFHAMPRIAPYQRAMTGVAKKCKTVLEPLRDHSDIHRFSLH